MSETVPCEALLLDVMDTIVWDPYRLIPGFFGMDWQTIKPLLDRSAWVRFERGELNEQQYLDGFFADGRPFDHRAFLALIDDNYRFVDGMEALLLELRESSVAAHALSNYPPWWERIEARLGLSRALRWTFVSCMSGVRKPDPAAFLGAADALDLSPSACLFVDDRRSNCDAAEAVGMPAICFEEAAQLREALAERGILKAR